MRLSRGAEGGVRMADRDNRDVEAYLARIRRTIAESSRLVEQANLRIAETDRMLESQGLTREQVMGMRFTDAQREAVNRELARLGLEPLEEEDARWETGDDSLPDVGQGTSDASQVSSLPSPDFSTDLAERQRKFGMMMKPFQI